VGGEFSGTFNGGWIGDNLEFFGDYVWCFVTCIITSGIFMHEVLCWEFTMFELIIEFLVTGQCIVAVFALCVKYSCH
jgi:hypothetical protein